MHTLHWIAVEADSAKLAFEKIISLLENSRSTFSWSDWYVVGGGRWSNSQYSDDPSEVVSYAEDPERFSTILNNAVLARQEVVLSWQHNMKASPEQILLKRRMDFQKPDVWPKPFIESPADKWDMDSYYLQKIIGILNGEYGPYSGYFDAEMYDTKVDDARERIESEAADRQYLVPVDFHF